MLSILVASVIDGGMLLAVLFVCIGAALALLGATRVLEQSSAVIAALICAVCALATLQVSLLTDMQEPFSAYFDKEIQLIGKVVQDPKHGPKHTQVVLAAESIDGTSVSGKVLVFADVGSRTRYLDYVVVTGKLLAPQPFETETGALFDYEAYLAAKGIGATMLRPASFEAKSPGCCSVLGILYALKHRLIRSIEEVFPEPHGGLLQGMLLGRQDALSQEMLETFRRSSLVHIVVLSGYNLTVIGAALMWLIGRAPRISRKMQLLAAALGMVLFAAMVGFSATVVRATIMALIALCAQMLRRPAAAIHGLIVAATVMVALNPRIMTDDPSFILSFLATFGLVTLGPSVAEKLTRIILNRGLREIAAATLATQLFVLPALIFYTGKASLVALPANMLALPLIPPAMFFGALAALAGLVSSALSFLCMLPAAALLWAITQIARIASLPWFASVDASMLQTPYIFCSYLLMVPLALWIAYTYTEPDGDARRMPIL